MVVKSSPRILFGVLLFANALVVFVDMSQYNNDVINENFDIRKGLMEEHWERLRLQNSNINNFDTTEISINYQKRDEQYDEAERQRIMNGIMGHRKLCNADEERQAQCLNRGVCYVVKYLNTIACNCLSAFCGPKCEIKAGKNLC